MEQFVFREFMQKEVVQKTIIFADAFHLNINGWRPANTKEHPYRINFYCDNLLVGYIDAIVSLMYFEAVGPYMPFALFTPFGKIKGDFEQRSGKFIYDFERGKYALYKIGGTFTVIKSYFSSKYDISSTVIKEDSQGVRTELRLRESGTILEMKRYGIKNVETARISISGPGILIEHFHYPNLKSRENLAEIRVLEQENIAKANFKFANSQEYQKSIEIPAEGLAGASTWAKLMSIGFASYEEDIKQHDPRMLDFMDEVDDAFTLPANGRYPIAIYDRMAKICFFGEKASFYYGFTRASNIEIALENNMVLKKMNAPKTSL